MDSILSLVGKHFQINRKLQGLAYKSVSEVTGIDRNILSKIENGQAPLSLERFIKLCKFYGLEPGAFLDAVLQEREAGIKDMALLSAKLYT